MTVSSNSNSTQPHTHIHFCFMSLLIILSVLALFSRLNSTMNVSASLLEVIFLFSCKLLAKIGAFFIAMSIII